MPPFGAGSIPGRTTGFCLGLGRFVGRGREGRLGGLVGLGSGVGSAVVNGAL